MRRKLLLVVFIIGLVYILAPGPSSSNDFSPIPKSLKSDEPGDTYQVPNVAAYFSDLDRKGITDFYKGQFRKNFIFGWLPPITLNYPPITAFQYVRDRLEQSTFLEEYVYPLRGSIFVNGYEPSVDREIKKNTKPISGGPMEVYGRYFKSKATIRYYPAPWHVSLLTYIGIWVASLYFAKLLQRAIKE